MHDIIRIADYIIAFKMLKQISLLNVPKQCKIVKSLSWVPKESSLNSVKIVLSQQKVDFHIH